MFEQKTIAITGGTGSFGKKFTEYLFNKNFEKLVIISRDEFKHDQMRKAFVDNRVEYRIADVRDKNAIYDVLDGVNYLFHAAALKQVPSCEMQPIEAVKTNIIGSKNVVYAAMYNKLDSVVVLSTDKAVEPINAMGISKAMMEKLAIQTGKQSRNTKINVTRYGNILFSRGSVLPYFIELCAAKQNLRITDPRMTRFLLPLEQAISLVQYALLSDNSGATFVRKSAAASIIDIADVIIKNFNPESKKTIVGIRPGEKLHETLLSADEMSRTTENEHYYIIGEDQTGNDTEPYMSNNTEQLSGKNLWKLISSAEELGVHSIEM